MPSYVDSKAAEPKRSQRREEIWKAALNVQLLLFHVQRTKGGEVG